jgi:hypothetical protein
VSQVLSVKKPSGTGTIRDQDGFAVDPDIGGGGGGGSGFGFGAGPYEGAVVLVLLGLVRAGAGREVP